MFGTSGIRGEVGEAVTAELALDVGRALGSMGHSHVVIGRDPRESGDLLTDAVSAGARECGADVTRLGVAATPTIARSVAWCDADVGVAVTASHNPPSDNGFKLWTESGQAFDTERRRQVKRRVISDRFSFAGWDGTGAETEWDGATERHVASVCETVPPVEDVTVAVDLGNGAGHATVDALTALGCDVETLNAQQDGRFPGRPSEPTSENCTSLRSFVASSDADLGVAHDGDADRMLAVTDDGAFLDGDVILALFARRAVTANEAVAIPVGASLAVDETVAAAGGGVIRTQVGDVHVAEAATDDGVVFGGEPSGAWIWPDETLCPDGTFAACRLASLVDRRGSLASLAAAIDTYPLRRTEVRTDAKSDAMEEVRRRVRDRYGVIDTTDGVRVEVEDGWFLVRASGTEPLVRITVECRTDAAADRLLETVREMVETATSAVTADVAES